jgi:hypothetical protein
VVNLYNIIKYIQATKGLTLVFLICCSNFFAQSIWTNGITGTNPNTANPYTSGQIVDPSITVSGIGRGTGISGTSATDRYSATGWNSGSIDLNDCFTFTLIPCATGQINFVSFVYTGQASGTGPSSFAFRSSLDGFTSNIGTPNAGGTTISLSAAAYQNITTPIVFKLYGWNASAAGGTWSVNDFTFNGTASCAAACTPPTIITAPISQTVCNNTAATFSVASSASVPSYQWQMSSSPTGPWTSVTNGTPVGVTYTSSATSPSLTVMSTGAVQYYYQCLVTESGTCTATTNTVSLSVNAAPTITLAPASKTVCSGSSVSFTASASGTSPTYQWYEDTGSGFTFISGATTKTLTLNSITTSMNSYSYQCIVTVAGCSTASTIAVDLTVNATPSAPPAPSPILNPACSTGTFAAISSTVAGVTWYWQTVAAGVSTSSVSSSNYTTGISTTIYLRALNITGTCWSSSSSNAITVNSPASISTQPIDKEVCVVGNTSFAVVGTGSAPKQWQYSSDGGITFTNVPVDAVHSNVTNATMNLTGPTIALNNYVYQCVVSVAGCPSVTSNTALLNVYNTPAAPPTPTAITNPACSPTSLIAMPSTVPGVTWYWQGITSGGSSTVSPTSSSYNISSSGTYYVRARANGSSCLSVPSSIIITINQPPVVTSNPIDKTQCAGTNVTFSVAATGSSLSYQWQVNTGSGFSNLTNTAPYSNVTSPILIITGITATMSGYQYQCIVSGAVPCAAVTSTVATLYLTASVAPSIAVSSPLTNSIACNGYNLSWTNGDGSNRLVVVSLAPVAGSPVNGTSYLSSSSFGTGGTISTGEYVVYKGAGSSVYVTGMVAATTYYYKIFEYNGCSLAYLTSGVVPSGDETTTNCTNPPGVTGVYIDACPGTGCNYEGNNELIWGTSGSYGFNIALNGPSLSYNSSSPPSPVFISNYGQNASAINALNAALGACGNTVFVDPNTLGYIPANAKFLIANICMCIPSTYDLSGLCGSGPIYVIFGTGPNWPCNTTGGVFGNSGSGVKYFDLDLAAWGVPLDPIYSFNSGSLVTGNGAAITLNPAGGTATGYFNSNCLIPITILPIELIDFYATKNGSKNDLVWKIASEKNIAKYIIEKSDDGINFNELVSVTVKDNADGIKSYISEDLSPSDGITYYRLSTVERNDNVNHYKIIDLDRQNDNWNTLYYQENDHLILEFRNVIPKNSIVSLFDLSGKLLADEIIKESQTRMSTANFAEGIYFIKISTPYKTQNFKIIIQK